MNMSCKQIKPTPFNMVMINDREDDGSVFVEALSDIAYSF